MQLLSSRLVEVAKCWHLYAVLEVDFQTQVDTYVVKALIYNSKQLTVKQTLSNFFFNINYLSEPASPVLDFFNASHR